MTRKYYNPPRKSVALPNLIQLQTDSYKWFFETGVKELLDEINPIVDFTGKNYQLEFGKYQLDEPKISEKIAKEKNLTYRAPLRCAVKLRHLASGKVQESDVFLGDFPLMTNRGTFIINGVERVVVTQIVRSYGVIFNATKDAGNKNLFGAKIIPTRGAWLEIETSARDVISVKIDRKRKIPITTFLSALGGYTKSELRSIFADVDTDSQRQYIKATLAKDTAKDPDKAIVEVYKRIRPGDLATAESARSFVEAMFFDHKRYNLGSVGRYKLNRRLGLNVPNTPKKRIITIDDIVNIVKEVIRLNNDPQAQPDDIDHLKNRRVRAVGELVQNRLRVGMLRLERIVKDRMAGAESKTLSPAQLVNNRPILAILQEFFASSQLSQFMDQTNPLSELEHKRRLAATGPGGLSRERAGFEVRDVHKSHYGRICPIATPDGPNIGLVGQLATFARINKYGFIETPYRPVEKTKGRPRVNLQKIEYLDAYDEEEKIIAPASTKLDSGGYILDKEVIVRKGGDPLTMPRTKVDYVDVSEMQTLSVSTALIPFLENDDATRASMGSNMLRQSVPLTKPESPLVGTGVEKLCVKDSGQAVFASDSGKVVSADSLKIVINHGKGNIKTYDLLKFARSNQGTCINQKPLVVAGERVSKNQIIAESSAIDDGELALGQNLKVAFMSFRGFNYEDSIIISERLVREDRLTSIHIEKHTIDVRETKLGPEVLTRDIPNVGEEALSNLDDQGIIRIGAEVSSGDILVGKISPKGETELSAEEKLLRAIFGEKSKDVMDTSLRAPHGEQGKVIDVKIFSKDRGDELPSGVIKHVEVSVAQLRKISVGDKLAGRHGNKGVISKILPEEDMPFLPDGTPVDIILNPLGVVSRMNLGQLFETHLGLVAENKKQKIATPVFEGASWENIQSELEKAGFAKTGKSVLYDGQTGERFEQEATVGIIYIMKLIHLVDDKIHARSTGPYSMITQQPLGGKAQFGGQRFGEMEVWALEAYGAAHTLQEMLTIKSDDVVGRARAYEAIIRGTEIPKPSVPASFNVLVRELQGLGLNVNLIGKKRGSAGGESGSVLKKLKKVREAPTIKIEKKGKDAEVTEIAAYQEDNPPKEETISEDK